MRRQCGAMPLHKLGLGPGPSRVQDFLLTTLQICTQQRYRGALESLETRLADSEGLSLDDLDEEELDYWVADWMVEQAEAGFGAASGGTDDGPLHRSFFGAVLSSLSRTRPRLRLKVSWKVYDVWGQKLPIRQAPASPPEILIAVAVLLVAVGKPILGSIVIACYAGLLRVGEALKLTHQDVYMGAGAVVFLLGKTKRGLEQKVTITAPSVIAWMLEYAERHPGAPQDRFFPASYTSFLKWLRQAAQALGAGGLGLSTHSLRRSGASELSRQGVCLPDLLAYGRWLSERSAREYVRRGEVAVLRAREAHGGGLLPRCARWAILAPHAFVLGDLVELLIGRVPFRLLTVATVQRLETVMSRCS